MNYAIDDLEAFRLAVRSWLADHMPSVDGVTGSIEAGLNYDSLVERHRELQHRLWEGGLAGICFPREYGGLGLSPRHRSVFNEEAKDYEMPTAFNLPTLAIIAPTLLEFGTPAQLQRHIPAMLRGDELWSQFLSEPSGGSDVAGALTSATRDGEEWVLNGSKIWTTFADHADYALCLARTDWNAPKHRGLSVFIVKIHQPGLEVRRIRLYNGSNEFCEEFLTDVRIPDDALIGLVNEGWAVGTRWMHHEKLGSGGGSQYTIGSGNGGHRGPTRDLAAMARSLGVADSPAVRQSIGEDWLLGRVHEQLVARVSAAVRSGQLPDSAAAITRLSRGVAVSRQATIARDVCGFRAAAWSRDDEEDVGSRAILFVGRQASCIGGGTVEMARNVISERLLGMPREIAGDRDRPFREVRRA